MQHPHQANLVLPSTLTGIAALRTWRSLRARLLLWTGNWPSKTTWKSSSWTLLRSSQPVPRPCGSPLPPTPNWPSADRGIACWKEHQCLPLSSGSSWHRWSSWETVLDRLSWASVNSFPISNGRTNKYLLSFVQILLRFFYPLEWDPVLS